MACVGADGHPSVRASVVYATSASRTCCGLGGGRFANRTETVSVCPSMTGTRLQEADIRKGAEECMSNCFESVTPPRILSASHCIFSSSPEM